MPDRPPNQIARLIAVGGVVTMFVLVVAVIAISAGGSSGDGDSAGSSGTATVSSGTNSSDPKIQKAMEKGEYRVEEGDTLTKISEATGIDIDTLIQLNPDTDPQALIAGRKIKLR